MRSRVLFDRSSDEEMGGSDDDATAQTPTMLMMGSGRGRLYVDTSQRAIRQRPALSDESTPTRSKAATAASTPVSRGTTRQAAAVAIQRRMRGLSARRTAAATATKKRAVVPSPPMPRSVGSARQAAAVAIQRRMRGMGARRAAAAARRPPLPTGRSLSSRMLSAGAEAAEAAVVGAEAAAVAIQRRTRGMFGRRAVGQAQNAARKPGGRGHGRDSRSHSPSSSDGLSPGDRLQALSRQSSGVGPSLIRALSYSLDDARNELSPPMLSREATEQSRKRAVAFVSSIGSPPSRQTSSVADVARALRPPAARRTPPSRPAAGSPFGNASPTRAREPPRSASGAMPASSLNSS